MYELLCLHDNVPSVYLPYRRAFREHIPFASLLIKFCSTVSYWLAVNQLQFTAMHVHSSISHIHAHITHTANEFSDYRLQDASFVEGGANVMLNSTTTRGCITINILNDSLSEATESIAINLESSNPGSNFTLSPSRTVVTILDNTGEYSKFLSRLFKHSVTRVPTVLTYQFIELDSVH